MKEKTSMLKNSLWIAPAMLVLVACGDTGGGAASASAAPAMSAKPMASAKPSASAMATASAAPAMSGSAAPATSGSAAAGSTVADADITPDMKDFLAGFKGKSKDVEASFKKHAKAGVKDADMGLYDMHDPKVTKMDKKDKNTCYDFDAAAGMTTRTYNVCWDAKNIVSVTDKGMK
jgi:hypothetical protein